MCGVSAERSLMASYNTNEFKGGLKIMLDGDPYTIVENEFVKPGKGQAFNRVKVRNLKTGKVLDKTFKSGESVEAADVHETDMQFLYSDALTCCACALARCDFTRALGVVGEKTPNRDSRFSGPPVK